MRIFLRNGIMPTVLPSILMERKEAAVQHISLEKQSDTIKQFFLTLPVDPQGSLVEFNGRAVMRLLPVLPAADPAADAEQEWSDAQHDRRAYLVDKEIDSILTPEEADELHILQRAFQRYLHRVAPLPLEDARRLHRELLEKAR